MKCLFCEKEFAAKRESAKFCSTNCRVKWHNKFGGAKKNEVKPFALQVLLNRVMDRLDKIEASEPVPAVFDAPKYKPIFDEPLQYKKPVIRRTKEYFESIILKGGCDEPEDHKIFIQEVNESNLHPKIKSDLITASRVRQY